MDKAEVAALTGHSPYMRKDHDFMHEKTRAQLSVYMIEKDMLNVESRDFKFGQTRITTKGYITALRIRLLPKVIPKINQIVFIRVFISSLFVIFV